MPVPFEETPFAFRKIEPTDKPNFIPTPVKEKKVKEEKQEEKFSKFNPHKKIKQEP